MRPHIGHPLYVYTPTSDVTRARMSASHRRRLGIPDGHVQIYGHHVPDNIAEPLRYWACWLAAKFGRAEAENFVRDQRSRGYPDIGRITEAWLLKRGASEIRKLVRSVREATAHGN